MATDIHLAVSDKGECIDPEFLPYVFDRFRQADSSKTRRHGGLGLGLSIVRQLVEAHSGVAHARSDERGHGAVFSVVFPAASERLDGVDQRLPLGVQSVPLEAVAASAPLAGLTVLVVDDVTDILDVIGRVLELGGATVVRATSAAQAFAIVRAQAIDVLISDIGMPDEDGYSLIRRLRALGKNFPAAALSAHAGPKDRDETLRAGCQLHIAKPVEPSALIESVLNLAKGAQG